MEQTVVRAKWLLDPNGRIVKDAMVIIAGHTFSYVGSYDSSLVERGSKILDYPRGLLIPPFINGHTHLPETLLRGICDDQDLNVWLYDYIWKIEPHMTENDAVAGTKLGIAEMIRTGTIGFLDQFYFSDKIAESVAETGVKALIAPSIFEGNAESGSVEKAFQINEKVFDKWHGYDNRIFVGFGPHAPYSLEEQMFQEIVAKSQELDTFLHTHLNEVEERVIQAKEKWGKSPIEKMEEWDALSNTYAAHCVHVSEKDISLLKKNTTTVLHNLQSNLKLGSGIAPVPKFLKNGINVCVGTDGSASNNNLDMLEELRMVSLIFKGLARDPKLMDSQTSLKLGTDNGSKIFPNGSYTGQLRKGSPADFVVFNMDGPHNTPVIDPISNLIYSSNSSDVTLTVCNGKVLFHNGKFKTLDIEETLTQARKSTEGLLEHAGFKSENNQIL